MSLPALLSAVIALVGGTVHTGDGTVLQNATVIVDGQKIQAVEAGLPAPANATIIDAKGKVVTPGLFDPYTTLGLVEIDQIETTVDADAGGDAVRAAQRVADSFNPDSVLIPIQRAHGVTTVVAAPRGGLISGQAGVFDLDHEATDTGLVAQDVGMPVALGAQGGGSRGAVLAHLREVLDDAAQYARNKKAWEKNQFRPLSAHRLDLEALQPVLEGKVPLLVSVNRRQDIAAVLDLAAELKLKIVLVGAAEAWKLAPRLAALKVPVIVDPVENAPDDFDRLGARADNAALLEKAGVPVLLSTFSAHNVRKLTQWAGNAVREGMPWSAALMAVTSRPAALFGLTDHGRLAPGQVANVVVWSGDPFELSSVAEHVLVRGRDVGQQTRQRGLVERYRALPPTK